MDAKHGVINEGRNGQEIKEVGKFPPNRRRPVSLEALIVKAIHLNKHSGSSLTRIHVCARECVVDGWVDGCEHVCDTRQKSKNLRDLARLVIASQESDALWVPDAEAGQQRDGEHAVVASVHVVP